MSIRLMAFDLDGTLIGCGNSWAVVGTVCAYAEWESQMEILHKGYASLALGRR